MPEGFTVRLSSIADFAETVNAVVRDYGVMSGQLDAADLTTGNPDFSKLLGVSNYQGSTEVNAAARAMLTKYTELYSAVRRTHEVIKKQLEHVAAALNETHQLYAEHDAKHNATFRSLLADLPTGGDDGPAGSR